MTVCSSVLFPFTIFELTHVGKRRRGRLTTTQSNEYLGLWHILDTNQLHWNGEKTYSLLYYLQQWKQPKKVPHPFHPSLHPQWFVSSNFEIEKNSFQLNYLKFRTNIFRFIFNNFNCIFSTVYDFSLFSEWISIEHESGGWQFWWGRSLRKRDENTKMINKNLLETSESNSRQWGWKDGIVKGSHRDATFGPSDRDHQIWTLHEYKWLWTEQIERGKENEEIRIWNCTLSWTCRPFRK